jgi:hypothetical protein
MCSGLVPLRLQEQDMMIGAAVENITPHGFLYPDLEARYNLQRTVSTSFF